MASNATTSATVIDGTTTSVVVVTTNSSSSSAASTSASTSSSSIAVSSSSSSSSPTSSSISTSSASSVAPSTSIVSLPPSSTVFVAPTTTSATPTVVATVETTIVTTANPASTGGSGGETVTVITTQSTVTETPSLSSSSSRSASSSASPTTLSAGDSAGGSSGLGTSGKIAIAVVIPLVVVGGLLFLGLFFWRRRKAQKNTQELRKNEMAEYGFNPNRDPTLAAVGVAAYTDGASEAADDAGYRGWGTTNSNTRKPSTTLGSNGRGPIGMAFSDNGSQPGGHNGYQGSPSNGASEHYSGDPLLNGHPEAHDGVGILGGAAAAGGVGAAAAAASRNHRNSQTDMKRGPSNASSSYSHGAPHSDSSVDIPYAGPFANEEVPYNIYNDATQAHGPYGDSNYNGGDAQPVIRDVQAKRNTRIERAPTFPQGGIAQNF